MRRMPGWWSGGNRYRGHRKEVQSRGQNTTNYMTKKPIIICKNRTKSWEAAPSLNYRWRTMHDNCACD